MQALLLILQIFLQFAKGIVVALFGIVFGQFFYTYWRNIKFPTRAPERAERAFLDTIP